MGTSTAAPIGAVSAGLGTAVNAIGQQQGLDAMSRAWGQQMQAQRGFDQALNERTQRLIQESVPQTLLAPQVAAETAGRLNTGSRNLAAAVASSAARKTSGAAANPEARARTGQAIQATLARALQDNRVQAALRALLGGQRTMDLLGREYAADTRNIRSDAQRWGGMVPMQQAVAGMSGSGLRQIGNLFNTVGQYGMNWGMSQPVEPTDDGGAAASLLRMNQARPGQMSER